MKTNGINIPFHKISRYFLLLFIYAIGSLSAYASGITHGGEAPWVRINAYDPSASVPSGQLEDGYFYLLVDRQCDVSSQSSYYRSVKRIISDVGVQNSTKVSFEYSKSFGRVIIHTINVIRDGKVSNRLDMSKLKVIQQQADLIENQYNDEMTGILLLEDIRKGDLLDISYTFTGANPIFQDKYYNYFNLGYANPVAKIYCSVIVPDRRTLHFRYLNEAPVPVTRQEVGHTVYTWTITDARSLRMDDGTPLGYDPYPAVSMTEYDTWLQVKKWAQDIYAPVINTSSPQVARIVADIENKYPDESSRVSAAVRYVQDYIRYFGVETGVNTHKPNTPASTLQLGYGDCKDKSILLCSILRAMHITAHPILVHTTDPSGVLSHLPTPYIFDHVCVQAIVHDTTYYFDATSASERADLYHLHFPKYMYGLVVTDTSTGITSIPYHGTGAGTIVHNKIIADDTTTPARLIVTTTYTGLGADRFRYQWNTQSHESIAKSYVNFYAREYPDIVNVEPVNITYEDSSLNMIKTEEIYSINGFWVHKDGELNADFYAYTLLSRLNRPTDKKRTMPLGINYPVNFREEFEISLPFDFTVKREAQTVDDSAFFFSASYSFTKGDNVLHLSYLYNTKNDNLPAALADRYFEDVKKVTDLIDYPIRWNPYIKNDSGGFSFFIFTIFIIVLVGMIWLVYRIYMEYDPPAAIHQEDRRRIGGWLIIPAIGISFEPLMLLYTFFKVHYFRDINMDIIFNKGATYYHPSLGYTILLEMVLIEALFVVSVLVALLFYQKRSSFPRVYVWFLAFLVATQLVEVIAYRVFSIEGDMITALVRVTIYAIVWGLYMQHSIRVRETFVFTRHPSLPSFHDRYRDEPSYDTGIDSHEAGGSVSDEDGDDTTE